jgi:salicylate hydroxylase
MGQDVSATQLKGPVLAADGMWSATRETLFPNSAAEQLDTFIYRGSIEMPQISGLELQNVNLWLYPGAHAVHYPLGTHRRLNIVAVAAAKGPKATFAQSVPILRELLNLVPEFIPWPAAVVDPLPQWHNENIMLIGDAAHGAVPWLAQGGAMALEDAAMLLETLDPVTFHQRRAPRCERLLKQTLAMGDIYHLSGFRRVARDLVLKTRSQNQILDRMAWIYQPT